MSMLRSAVDVRRYILPADPEWRSVYARHERLSDGTWVPKPAKSRFRTFRRRNPDTYGGWEYVSGGLDPKGCEWRTPGLTTKPHKRAYRFTPYPINPRHRTFDIPATNLPHKRCAYRDLPIAGLPDLSDDLQLSALP